MDGAKNDLCNNIKLAIINSIMNMNNAEIMELIETYIRSFELKETKADEEEEVGSDNN